MALDLKMLRKKVLLHGKVCRTAIIEAKGSVPRGIGTEMLTWEGGQHGTIGGGALEFQATKEGFEGEYLKTIPLGPNLGQCCGGSVTLVNEIFNLDRLDEMNSENFFSRQISGSNTKPLSIVKLEQNINNTAEPTEKCVLSKGWLFESIKTNRIPIWVYGAGHVGRALIQILSPFPEFDLTWLDTGKERFPKNIHENVKVLYSSELPSLTEYAPDNCQHFILTYSHALDLDLCHRLLGRSFYSVGLIGSKTKWVRFQKRLTELGHPLDNIQRISCPIGNPLLGKQPQAVAISLAQELLLSLNAVKLRGTVKNE